ncbi:MAG TPA: prepilin-type N-terminal cleavage/methylation domain-containing protein [Dongiaceae bacterium]|nr:prepilin-type N-terminal cleavage/methylation domain-containing protein [Dongiaceae bacterium]
MNHVDKTHKGFTLIELMLAMTFISVLLLAIAMTIIQVGAIYNKGVALKDINQSGRGISDDISRTVAASEAFSLTTDYVTGTDGGRVCLGSYSYIWNYAKSFPNGSGLTWNQNDTTKGTQLHLVKVPDAGKIYCQEDGTGALSYPYIRTADVAQSQELIPSGDHSLGIEQLTLSTTTGPNDTAYDPATNERLYALTYVLGTGNISAMNNTQTACLPPGSANSDVTYCNVEQFSLVLRAGNRVN